MCKVYKIDFAFMLKVYAIKSFCLNATMDQREQTKFTVSHVI